MLKKIFFQNHFYKINIYIYIFNLSFFLLSKVSIIFTFKRVNIHIALRNKNKIFYLLDDHNHEFILIFTWKTATKVVEILGAIFAPTIHYLLSVGLVFFLFCFFFLSERTMWLGGTKGKYWTVTANQLARFDAGCSLLETRWTGLRAHCVCALCCCKSKLFSASHVKSRFFLITSGTWNTTFSSSHILLDQQLFIDIITFRFVQILLIVNEYDYDIYFGARGLKIIPC